MEKVDYGQATRTKKPRFELIPYNSLVALANRFDLGEERHKPKAWNGLAENRETALTKEWATAAAQHVISHAYLFLEKINGITPDDGDDDGAAIMFGGCVMVEYMEKLKKERNGALD